MSIKFTLKYRESIRSYSFLQSLVLAGPLLVILIVFYLYPLIKLFPESLFFNDQFSLEHYNHFFRESLYSFILIRTLRIAFYVTTLCLIIGYPVSYYLSELKSQRLCNLLMICILLPFFTSILVRSYAWIALFQTKGIVNSFLYAIGVIDKGKPLNLLYNEFAVLVGMVHIMLPFMILPIFSVLKNIDSSLVQAARNLGAGAIKAFLLITLPLSISGVGAGVILTFILSLGFFITPALLGGPTTLMISTLIDQQVNKLGNWEFAATISVLLLLTTIISVMILDKIIGLDKIYRE